MEWLNNFEPIFLSYEILLDLLARHLTNRRSEPGYRQYHWKICCHSWYVSLVTVLFQFCLNIFCFAVLNITSRPTSLIELKTRLSTKRFILKNVYTWEPTGSLPHRPSSWTAQLNTWQPTNTSFIHRCICTTMIKHSHACLCGFVSAQSNSIANCPSQVDAKVWIFTVIKWRSCKK